MFTYFYRPLRFYAQAQCLRAGAVPTFSFLSTDVWVREGHDAPVQAPAPRVTALGTHTCRHLVDGVVACSSLLPLCLAFVGSLQAGQHNTHVMTVQPFLLLYSLLFFLFVFLFGEVASSTTITTCCEHADRYKFHDANLGVRKSAVA